MPSFGTDFISQPDELPALHSFVSPAHHLPEQTKGYQLYHILLYSTQIYLISLRQEPSDELNFVAFLLCVTMVSPFRTHSPRCVDISPRINCIDLKSARGFKTLTS
jgi:hypothetical protein